MGIKNIFKREENLTKELKMLPRDTRKRILDNVNKRRNEILEEKMLEKQLKEYSKDNSVAGKQGKWSLMRDGMRRRREELTKQGILKPLIRYDKKTFKSPLQEMSEKSRAADIKRIDDQRNRMKAGHNLGIGNGINDGLKIKIKPLKLKSPGTMNSKSSNSLNLKSPPTMKMKPQESIIKRTSGTYQFFKQEKKKKKHGFI